MLGILHVFYKLKKILLYIGDYETARRRAKRAEETSDLTSGKELGKRKPKRNRVRYPSSSDDGM